MVNHDIHLTLPHNSLLYKVFIRGRQTIANTPLNRQFSIIFEYLYLYKEVSI